MSMRLVKIIFKNNYKIILVSMLIYFISTIIGFCIYQTTINTFNGIPDITVIKNKRIETYFTNLNLTSILSNNIVLIIQLTIGSALFGVTTFSLLIYNGILFGILLANSIESKVTISEILLLTLPHGIFEIPAVIIAGAAGFKTPYEIVRYLAGKKEQILTKKDIEEYLTLALISIILIVIVAFVEAYITPRIAEYFLKRV